MKFTLYNDAESIDISTTTYRCFGDCKDLIEDGERMHCVKDRERFQRYYTWPTHDEHDMLVNDVDNRNTRMIHNFVNMGFDIKDVGQTYFYHKWHYFSSDNQHKFHRMMDGLRQILESSRIFAVNMFAYSRHMSMYTCDFVWLSKASKNIFIQCLEAYGLDYKEMLKFYTSFINQLKDRSEEIGSWAGKRLPKDRKDFDLVDSLDFVVKKQSKSTSLRDLRWLCSGEGRILFLDLPFMMFESVRMRVAETREDGCYSDLDDADGWDECPTYADIVNDEALLYAPRS